STWLCVNLTCGMPFTFVITILTILSRPDKSLGKLRITQATLFSWGPVWALSTDWCVVQVKVGSKNPILICKFVRNSLIESIHLNLEFNEGGNEIVFELLSTSYKVHLTGYHDGNNGGPQGATEKKKVKEETDTFYRWPQ
ncbi:hypothetical protein MKX03_018704, partial [Papaver bracteatum]